MIDIIALVSFAEMQVYRRPVVHFGVINAHSATPASHIRQRAVCCPDVFVVCDRDLLRAVPDAHAFCNKIAVLFRALFPVAVFIVDLLHQMRKIGQGRVCHAPVFRVVHLVLGVQAADERQKAFIRFAFKQNSPTTGKVIVQRTVRYIAVGCKKANARFCNLALAGDKHFDVVVVLVLMHLVEDDRAGTHTIAPLGVIGAAFYLSQILATLQHLFCVIVKP